MNTIFENPDSYEYSPEIKEKVEKIRKEVDGKAFVAELEKCKTPNDIFALLVKSMDEATLKDRVKFLKSDLIVALESSKAMCNAALGFRTSHEAMVNMAAGRYQKITQGNIGKKVECFRKELAEYTLKHSMDNQQNLSPLNPLIAARTAVRGS